MAGSTQHLLLHTSLESYERVRTATQADASLVERAIREGAPVLQVRHWHGAG